MRAALALINQTLDEALAEQEGDADTRLTVWESVHHSVRAFEGGGESAAAVLVAKLGSGAGTARELCYRLYTLVARTSPGVRDKALLAREIGER